MSLVKETTVTAEEEAETCAEMLPRERALPPLTAEDEGEPTSDAEAETTEPAPTEDAGGPEIGMCVPPASDDEDTAENNVEISDFPEADGDGQYDAAHGQGHGEVDLCLPPPSDEEEEHENIPYPLPSDDEAVPYPVDVEYPVDDAYPNTSDAYGDGGGEMAAVAPYPTDTDGEGGFAVGEPGVMPPPKEEKKEYTGDRAVVGFVPTNLRVKRRAAAPAKKTTRKKASTTPRTLERQEVPTTNNIAEESEEGGGAEASGKGKYSVADDYNKFMEEISQL